MELLSGFLLLKPCSQWCWGNSKLWGSLQIWTHLSGKGGEPGQAPVAIPPLKQTWMDFMIINFLSFGKLTEYVKYECFELIRIGNIPILGPNYCKVCESEGKGGFIAAIELNFECIFMSWLWLQNEWATKFSPTVIQLVSWS